MEVNDLVARHERLKESLQRLITQEIREFRRDTGITVSRIDVDVQVNHYSVSGDSPITDSDVKKVHVDLDMFKD